jgi:hypothetical protein
VRFDNVRSPEPLDCPAEHPVTVAPGGLVGHEPGNAFVQWAGTRVFSRTAQVLGLGVALLVALPTSFVLPRAGLDASWMLGLALAHDGRLRFGHDVVFTYGPWGLLDHVVLLDPASVVVAVIFGVGALLALWRAIWSTVAPVFGPAIGSATATLVAVSVFAAGGSSFALLLTIVTGVLRSVRDRTVSTVQVVLYSAGAALLLQVKFPEGVLALVFAGVVALLSRRLSHIACFIAVAPTSFVTWWLVAGQRVGDLWHWLRLSMQLVSGYQGAMYYEDPGARAGLVLAALLVTMVLASMLKEVRTEGALTTAILTAGLIVFAAKEGFVRHDVGHQAFFFAAATVAALNGVRRSVEGLIRLGLVAVSCVVVMQSLSNPRAVPSAGWGQAISFMSESSARHDMTAEAAADVRSRTAIPGAMIASVGRRPLHVDPVETSVAWAYGLNWHPVPVFQDYSAYTPALDGVNTRMLLSTPRMAVLRQPLVVDDRLQAWDPPSYNRALVCYFEPAMADPGWVALIRRSDRCGAPRTLRSLAVPAGRSVDVPVVGGNQMLTMSFTPRPSSVRALISLVAKDPEPLRVTFAGQVVRLPRSLAGGPLMARVPASASWTDLPTGDQAGVAVAFNKPGTLTFGVTDLAP